MGKGEIARYEQFLLFPQCFQKACFPGASKCVVVWEWVKSVPVIEDENKRDSIYVISLSEEESMVKTGVLGFQRLFELGKEGISHIFLYFRRVSTWVLLFCVGTVLSQRQGPRGPPPSPPGPAQKRPPPGPPQDVAQGGPQPEPVQYSVQQPDQGSSGGAQGTTEPSAANPWHELLHRMMDLMTAAASGGPLPSDPPSSLGAHHSTGQHAESGKPKQPAHTKPKNSPVHHNKMPPTQPTKPPTQPPTQAPTQPPTQPKNSPSKQQTSRPVVADCFWEGKFYRPGSDIVRGQHDRWCYVTYCDSNGKIQFWDDYNCPPNSMKPTSSHSSGSGRNGNAGGQKKGGCHHKGMYYEPGQEIDQHNVGERCYGTYCNLESKVVQWEDWCTSGTTTMPTTRRQQPPKPKGGKRKGKGRRGKKQQKRGGGGGGAGGAGGRGGGQEIEGRRPRKQGGGQRQGGGGGGGRRHAAVQGCYHNQLYYQPNEDVIVGNIGDMCYGYYCEGNNVFVHWEDRCTPTTPMAPTTMSMTAGNFYFKK